MLGTRVLSGFMRIVGAFPCLVALAAGAWQWSSAGGQSLDPDARNFLTLASAFDPLSGLGSVREPIWIALLSIPVRLMGPSPGFAGFLGVAGFGLMVFSFQLLAKRLYGPFWSVVGALCLAVSPWLVYQSAKGLREEAAAGLTLLFALAMLSENWNARRAVGLGVLLGATALLRWDTLLLTLPVLGLALVRQRLQVRMLLACLVTVAVLVAPYLVGNWLKYGDPMYHSNYRAMWFRNLEFQGRPGFPTIEEVKENRYTGPHITWAGYLFGLHSPAEIVKRSVWGVAAIPYGTTSLAVFRPAGRPVPPEEALGSLSQFLMVAIPSVLVLAGAVGGLLLFRGHRWPVGAILFLSVVEFAPIAVIFDPRLALTVVPFLLLGLMETLASITGRIAARRGQRVAEHLSVSRLREG